MNFACRLVGYEPKTGKQLWLSKGLTGSIYTTPACGEGTVVAMANGIGAKDGLHLADSGGRNRPTRAGVKTESSSLNFLP